MPKNSIQHKNVYLISLAVSKPMWLCRDLRSLYLSNFESHCSQGDCALPSRPAETSNSSVPFVLYIGSRNRQLRTVSIWVSIYLWRLYLMVFFFCCCCYFATPKVDSYEREILALSSQLRVRRHREVQGVLWYTASKPFTEFGRSYGLFVVLA